MNFDLGVFLLHCCENNINLNDIKDNLGKMMECIVSTLIQNMNIFSSMKYNISGKKFFS
ncbi:hypothetical protein BGAFAR04_F0027 (plasmid) [Borreliella garinii Far04]|nr:hypothetical protein BGAFAR04_F0027 [Borreliella garinii Far04]